MQKFYKNVYKIHSSSEIATARATVRHYIDINRGVDSITGEIKEYFPDVCRSKKWKKTSLSTREQKLLNQVESLNFYTLVLADYNKNWARYDTIFTKADKIRALLKRIIKGPFIAIMEVSAYAGGHVHIVCAKQNHRLLKAEYHVYNHLGLMRYFSKSPINYKDKKNHPEIYEVMVGMYLQAKAAAKNRGEKLSRRSSVPDIFPSNPVWHGKWSPYQLDQAG